MMRTGALAAALLLLAALETDMASATFAGAPAEGPSGWTGPCDPNCFTCNERLNKCVQCGSDGYSPDAAGVCRKCPPGCSSCRPWDGRCYRCGLSPDGKFPMFLNKTTHTCQRCLRNPVSSGCTECDRRGRCKSCTDTDYTTGQPTRFFLVDGRCIRGKNTRDVCYEANAKGDCTMCHDAYTATPNGLCKMCAGGNNGWDCASCDPQTLRCTSCWEGSLQKGRCVPCKSKGCLDCAKDPSVCKSCYYITPDNEDPDNDWSFYRVGDVCKECTAPHCRNCNNDGTCRECKYGYEVVRGKCKPAPPVEDHYPCIDWDAETKRCKECFEGFWLNRTANTCKPCRDGCLRCTDGGRCTRCDRDLASYPGYGMVNGRCLECDDPLCFNCDGNVKRCKRCFDYMPYYVDKKGRCVLP